MLTTGAQRHEKLNWLQRNLLAGLLVDAAWLEHHGYSTALRSKYVAHGWLDSVARGVYRRPTAKLPDQAEQERLRWQDVVVSLQTLLGHALHVGGRTALELEGFAHYLALAGPREIHLYGVKAPPGWLSRLELDTRFVFHNAGKLFVESCLHPTSQTERCRLNRAPIPALYARPSNNRPGANGNGPW